MKKNNVLCIDYDTYILCVLDYIKIRNFIKYQTRILDPKKKLQSPKLLHH